MIDIPQLTTERLLLRGFHERDLDNYAAMMADAEVTRFLADGKPLSRADAWRHMALFTGHWTLRGFGMWAVEERTTGQLVGRIGCHMPEGWPAFEIGYVLARAAWGKGYAREGASISLKYARETLARTEIVSLIRPANTASIRVAESLGAVRAETIDFLGAPTVVYRYPEQASG